MDLFVKKIFEKIQNFDVCPKRFEILKEKYARALKNYKTKPLYQLTNYYVHLITTEMSWSYEELTTALTHLSADSILTFLKNLFSCFNIETFFHGNLRKENAVALNDILNEFIAHFKSTPLTNHPYSFLREIQLTPGSHHSYEVAIDIQKPKSINVYFQICFDDIVETSKLHLLGQILNEPFFDVLRTKEQLGYVVYNTISRKSNVYGINFVIQSDYGTDYLDNRIEAFLVWAEVSTKVSGLVFIHLSFIL